MEIITRLVGGEMKPEELLKEKQDNAQKIIDELKQIDAQLMALAKRKRLLYQQVYENNGAIEVLGKLVKPEN